MATTIIGILLIVMAVFLVIAVLMQSSKDHRLGSSIAGGAETFFGKAKGKSLDALFNKLTTIIAVIFVVLVVVLYVIQPEPCAFCGSPEHTVETVEECPTYQQAAEEAAKAEAEEKDEAPAPEAEEEAPETAEEAPEVTEEAPETADVAEGEAETAEVTE